MHGENEGGDRDNNGLTGGDSFDVLRYLEWHVAKAKQSNDYRLWSRPASLECCGCAEPGL